MRIRNKFLTRFMVTLLMALLLASCDNLSVFVPPAKPPSLDKISSVHLDEEGQLTISWDAKPQASKSTYQLYLLELPAEDQQYTFSSAALYKQPLKVEELELPLSETPKSKGELINTGSDLQFVLTKILEPGRRYLVQILEKGRRYPDGKHKVQLVEVEFENFAATSASAIGNSVVLSWEPISGANRYEVYADKEMTALLSSTTQPSATIDSVNGQFPKEFYVRAFRGQLAAPEPVLIKLKESTVVITKVESTSPNGNYTIGDRIDFKVTFSDKVNIFGTSELPLMMGPQRREATYSSGNGSAIYFYSYTVVPGDDTERLASGSLLTGEFIDATGLSVSGKLPSTGSNSTLAELNAITIDTIAPTVPSSVSFDTAITRTGDFAVSWTAGQDQYFLQHNLKLCSNADCSIGCVSSQAVVGTSQTFNAHNAGSFYACVQSEDTSGLTSDWVASPAPILIDNSPPLITRVHAAGADGIYKETQSIVISVEFNENVTVTSGNLLTLKLETGGTDREAIYTSGSGTGKLDFTYTVQAGDINPNLNYHDTDALSIGAGSIKDIAGNDAILTLPALNSANSLALQNAVIVDTTAPAAPHSVTFPAAQSASTSFSMSWSPSTDSNFKQHNAKLCLVNDCSTSCTAVSSSVASPLTVTGSNGNHYYGCVQGEDLVGHLSAWVASASTIHIDTSFPYLINVSSPSPDGAYKTGDTIDIALQFSEVVQVTGEGSIRLQLETGTNDGYANYLSGHGSDTLTFRYTVLANDFTANLNYLSTNALTLSGGTIKDITSNNADLTLPDPSGLNSLATQHSIALDTAAPSVPSNISFPGSTTNSTSLGFTWTASTDPHFFRHNIKLCSASDCSTLCSAVTTEVGTSGVGTGVDGSSYYACVQGEDSLGHTSAWASSTASTTVDTSGPTVIDVTSGSADGIYKAGDTLSLSVEFSENVVVTNEADLSLMLETGDNDHFATYVSGSGSDTLVFSYTVQAGDTSADLDFQSIGSLSRGASGTIKDSVGNDAILGLPALGGVNSIAGKKAIILDTTAPIAPSSVGFAGTLTNSLTFNMSWTNSSDTNFVTHNVKICTDVDCDSGCESTLTSVASPRTMTGVNGATYYGCVQGQDGAGLTSNWVNSSGTMTIDASDPTVVSVSSTQVNGPYKAGVTIPITVLFNETVVVANEGDLYLTLETGTPDRNAVYASGHNSNTLTFHYTVQAGDTSIDLNYIDTDSLKLGASGTIKDLSGNDAIRTLPGLASANSLGTLKDLVIDTTAPDAPVILSPANSAYSTTNVTTVTGTSETGAVITVIKGGSPIGTGTATGTNWTVTLDAALTDGSHPITATASDAAGNVSGASTTHTFTVDTSDPDAPTILIYSSPTNDTTPAVSGTSEPGMTIQLFADGLDAGSTLADGSGNWALNLDTLLPGTYAITAKAVDQGLRESPESDDITLHIDTTAPTVSSINSTTVDGAYGIASTISVTVNFSENVTVSAIPQIQLEAGGSDPQASYVSGSTSSSLVFEFTVTAGHASADLDYVATNSLAGTIKDAAGNDAILTLPNPGEANSLAANKALVIDGVAPAVTNINSTNSNTMYGPDAVIDIQVTFSKSVTVASATPTLTLNTTPIRSASYVSGSTSNVLTFQYTVQTNDVQADLNATALVLNGATIRDAVSNDASLTVPASLAAGSLNQNKNIQIAGDSVAPVLTATPPSQSTFTGTAITSVNVDTTIGNDKDADDTSVTYTCRFDTTNNGAMDAGGTDCASLPASAYSFNSNTGVLTWTASAAAVSDLSAPTVYEFQVIGTDPTLISDDIYFTVTLLRPFTATIGFDAGDSANYTFDPSLIDFSGGFARLLASDQTDDDSSVTGFGGAGADPGTGWISDSLRIGNFNSCNGADTNCIISGNDWTVGTKVIKGVFDVDFAGWTNSGDAAVISSTTKKAGAGSAYFDGVNAHISRAQVASDNFTYNYWIKTTQAYNNGQDCTKFLHGASVVTSESPLEVNDWGTSLCDGYIIAGVGNPDTSIRSYYVVNDDKWHMISFTRNKASGLFALYVDGELQGTATGNTNTLNAGANINVGAVSAGAPNKFVGYLDDLHAWQSVLTQDDIQTLYSHMSSRFAGAFLSRVMDSKDASAAWGSLRWKTSLPFGKELPDLGNSELMSDYSGLANNILMNQILGLWHLNETAAGTIADTSGNGIHGTISSSTGMGQLGRLGKAINPWQSSGISLGTNAALNTGGSSLTFAYWFKTQQPNGRIYSSNFINTSGVLIENLDSRVKVNIGCADGPNSDCIEIKTNNTFTDGAWHHVAVAWNRSTQRMGIYVDGFLQPITSSGGYCGTVVSKELDTSSCANVNANPSEAVWLGSRLGNFAQYFGLLDEFALWKRALSEAEILTVYRRGANRIFAQVRSCANASCTGNTFNGSGATSISFFSEFNNNSTPTTGAGTVLSGLPNMDFADFPNTPSNRRYVQYRLFMESDDTQALCSGVNCSPELQSVTLGPDHYPLTNPDIVYASLPYYNLASFSESVTCSGGVKYQLSRDNSTWYYHNGASWVASNGTLAESSTAASINTNAASFDDVVGRTALYVKALLPSNGVQQCEINSITVTGNNVY